MNKQETQKWNSWLVTGGKWKCQLNYAVLESVFVYWSSRFDGFDGRSTEQDGSMCMSSNAWNDGWRCWPTARWVVDHVLMNSWAWAVSLQKISQILHLQITKLPHMNTEVRTIFIIISILPHRFPISFRALKHLNLSLISCKRGKEILTLRVSLK